MAKREVTEGSRAWVSADEAAAILDVKRTTLYAYASRGLVRTALSEGRSRARRYAREDVERLRTRSQARAGHAPVAAGALRWGEPVLETAVGTITARGPSYRGRAAIDLAVNGTPFEDVCRLLWGETSAATPAPASVAGPAPASAAAAAKAKRARDASARATVAELVALGSLVRSRARAPSPFDAMLAAASLGRAATQPDVGAGASIVRYLVAACALGAPPATLAATIEASFSATGVAEALLVALGGAVSTEASAVMNEALVLAADHELNASTFAARVAASAGANLGACVVAALATLSGTHHGGLTAGVEDLVDAIGAPEHAPRVVAELRARGDAVPGFGHPLYPGGDPRGTRLLALAQNHAPRARTVRTLTALTSAMELASNERPTLDVGLVAASAALSLRPGSALAIFACGRLGGWIAHAVEQRAAGYLLRPRARYVGIDPG